MKRVELQGTEKQIKWAEEIREKFLAESEEFITSLEESYKKWIARGRDWTEEYYLETRNLEPLTSFAELREARELIASIDEAGAWINTRNQSAESKFSGFCRRLRKGYPPEGAAHGAVAVGLPIGG